MNTLNIFTQESQSEKENIKSKLNSLLKSFKAEQRDILIVLLSMASEQFSKIDSNINNRLYYTLAEICSKLGINENNSLRIEEEISHILNSEVSITTITTVTIQEDSISKKIIEHSESSRIFLEEGLTRSKETNEDLYFVKFSPHVLRMFMN